MKKESLALQFVRSWADTEGKRDSTGELLEWIRQRNASVKVEIRQSALEDSPFWYYDRERGEIRNRSGSFFSICGLQQIRGEELLWEQPVILQEEIGYLGIIGMELDGVLHFLMQAKIEPGNLNKVQISPTIQATKSNFTQKHGGGKPPYLDYFLHAEKYTVVVDQLQSEQSSRFYKKRNRNIILLVDKEPELLPSHRWMTLGQIKELMRRDNLVNMDTRTVLSCIPYALMSPDPAEEAEVEALFADAPFYRSVFQPGENALPHIYGGLNDYKMFSERRTEVVPLFALKRWEMREKEFVCLDPCDFKVIFCDIEIEGREVKRWTQPLFCAAGIATFGLLFYIEDGVRKFVVTGKPETGCFDQIELAPTVQLEASAPPEQQPPFVHFFFRWVQEHPELVRHDVLLSEEGGRFYHEQNRNLVAEIPLSALGQLPPGYFGVDYRTLNLLTQVNNCLNIQLRNLLSLLQIGPRPEGELIYG